MEKLYMGLDVGSITTKGVIIDKYNNIITSSYLYTKGNPVSAVNEAIKSMSKSVDFNNYQIVSVGVTGFSRRLVGVMLGATLIKNEITAEAVGTITMYPDVKTIFEIGGQNSKIIFVNDKKITYYDTNTLCASGMGTFIDNLARRLDIPIGNVALVASTGKREVNISKKCIVYAEVDLFDKMQVGYKKEDILLGACKGIANNYVSDVIKENTVSVPIVFNGGVSKNMIVVKELENIIHKRIIVNNNSHLMASFGVAIMARQCGIEKVFDINSNYNIETKLSSCSGCANNCDVVMVYRNNHLIDAWGNRCEKGNVLKNV